MKIYTYIKFLNNNDDNNSYNELSKYILVKPMCLFTRKTYFTPFIYAASLNLKTLQKLYSIYTNSENKPNHIIEPYEASNIDGYNLLHYTVKMILKYKKTKFDKIKLKYWNEIFYYIIHNMNVNINSKNSKGNTILHVAVEHDCMDLVKTCIYYNVKINKYNFYKQTPLQISYKNRNKDIFKFLLYKKADYHLLNGNIIDDFKLLINEYKRYYNKKLFRVQKTKAYDYIELKELYIKLYNLCYFYSIQSSDKENIIYSYDNDNIFNQLIKYQNDSIILNKKYFLYHYLYNDKFDYDSDNDYKYNIDSESNDEYNYKLDDEYNDDDYNDDDYDNKIKDNCVITDNTLFDIFNDNTIYNNKDEDDNNTDDIINNDIFDIFDININYLIENNMKKRINNLLYIKNIEDHTLKNICDMILYKILIYL